MPKKKLRKKNSKKIHSDIFQFFSRIIAFYKYKNDDDYKKCLFNAVNNYLGEENSSTSNNATGTGSKPGSSKAPIDGKSNTSSSVEGTECNNTSNVRKEEAVSNYIDVLGTTIKPCS